MSAPSTMLTTSEVAAELRIGSVSRMSVSKKHSSAARRKSGKTLTSNLAEAQARVDRVLAELDQCATRKLRELLPELREIRNDFNALKRGQTISDCRNWAEFCKQKLHRTKQAVNQLLAERKETFHQTEQTEEQDEEETWDGADPASEISDDPSTEDEATDEATDLDRVNKKIRHFFRPFEEPEDIAKTLNEILVHQYPSRRFIVTVEEVFTEAPATDEVAVAVGEVG